MTRSLLLGLTVLLAGVAHAAAARHLQQVGRPRPTRPFGKDGSSRVPPEF